VIRNPWKWNLIFFPARCPGGVVMGGFLPTESGVRVLTEGEMVKSGHEIDQGEDVGGMGGEGTGHKR